MINLVFLSDMQSAIWLVNLVFLSDMQSAIWLVNLNKINKCNLGLIYQHFVWLR